jgi:hypothetical protein
MREVLPLLGVPENAIFIIGNFNSKEIESQIFP